MEYKFESIAFVPGVQFNFILKYDVSFVLPRSLSLSFDPSLYGCKVCLCRISLDLSGCTAHVGIQFGMDDKKQSIVVIAPFEGDQMDVTANNIKIIIIFHLNKMPSNNNDDDNNVYLLASAASCFASHPHPL